MDIDFKKYHLGMIRDGSVVLTDHQESWSQCFSVIVEKIQESLSPFKMDLHHIGSTSIPGIKAKPILDVLGVVDDIDAFDIQQKRMESLGFVWKGEYGISGRRYCVHYDDQLQAGFIHLHAFAKNDPQVEKHLIFRDYLRAFSHKAAQYEATKIALAGGERKLYSEGKGPVIELLNDEAFAWKRMKKAS